MKKLQWLAKSKRITSSLITGAFLATQLFVPLSVSGLFSASASASAIPGNNGTIKVDGNDLGSGPDNDPHVGCSFDIAWWNYDQGSLAATVDFELQSPTTPPANTMSVTGDLSPTFTSPGGASVLDHTESYTLAFTGAPQQNQGYHVKLTVETPYSQGNDTKSKVFWVEGCNPTSEQPTATATLLACTAGSGLTDKISVKVYNTDDNTNQTVTYTVELGGQTKTITLADGANGNVEFAGLAVGPYTATITGDDGTGPITTNEVTVGECPHLPGVPTASAGIVPCRVNSGTNDIVDVHVTNTADTTNKTVTYTIELGGQTKTLTLVDGATGNVQFGGLATGPYTATITGDDGTGPITTNEVTVGSCPYLPAAPTATATVIACTADSGTTDKVSVRVYNTDDNTNQTVTYTITMGGQTKTLTLADGTNGNVEFGGLATGSYTATITGDDGTGPITTNEVTVGECPAPAPTEVTPVVQFNEPTCENTSGRVTVTAINGVIYKVNGNVITGTTSFAAGSSVTVTAELAQGFTLANGAKGSFSHTFNTAPTDCVLGATDVCPNITGDQATVPAGMTKDQTTGNCVTTTITGGRGGGGEVLGASTTAPVLVNTGESPWAAIVIGLTVISLSLTSAFVSRRQRLDA